MSRSLPTDEPVGAGASAGWPMPGAMGHALRVVAQRTGALLWQALGPWGGLSDRERRVLQLVDDCPLLMMVVDRRGRVAHVSRFGAQRLGYEASSLRGQPLLSLYESEHRPNVQHRVTRLLEGQVPREGPASAEVHTWEALMTHAEGHAVWVRHTARRFRAGELLVVCEDVTELHQLADRLRHDAAHDPLTGLVNRREFERQLAELCLRIDAGRATACLCLIDVDGFKGVNDDGGHAAGDAYLRELARALGSVLPATDTLARLGGDEFAVLLRGCTLEEAAEIGERLREAARRLHFVWNDRVMRTSVSVGVSALFRGRGGSEALARADAACYAAKHGGRDQVRARQ